MNRLGMRTECPAPEGKDDPADWAYRHASLAPIAEARGFVRVRPLELHAWGISFGAQDRVLGEQLDRLFFGAQDYAVIGHKP
jgi:hypothetical protein